MIYYQRVKASWDRPSRSSKRFHISETPDGPILCGIDSSHPDQYLSKGQIYDVETNPRLCKRCLKAHLSRAWEKKLLGSFKGDITSMPIVTRVAVLTKVIEQLDIERTHRTFPLSSHHTPEEWTIYLQSKMGEVSEAVLALNRYQDTKKQIGAVGQYQTRLLEIAAVSVAAILNLNHLEEHGNGD